MRLGINFFVLIILLAIAPSSYSQIQYNNVRFKQLGIANGLSHSTVNAITQDRQGFLWFGTRNGLCKYDGYTMKHFFHLKNDPNSLCHDFIYRPLCRQHTTTGCGSLQTMVYAAYDYKTELFKKHIIRRNHQRTRHLIYENIYRDIVGMLQ
jgi:ligand-binding sensor domain-containing protein